MKIKINISTSSVTIRDERMRSLIKCLYVILLLKTEKMNTAREQILRDNSLPAKEFLKEHRLGSLVFGKLFEAALHKKDIGLIQPQLDAVFLSMRKTSKLMSSNDVLNNTYVGIIRDFRSYVQSDNDNAYARLERNAKETGEIAIYGRFLPLEQDASVHIRTLKRIIKKYEPDNDTLVLSIDVAAELRADNPVEYKGYLAVKNNLKKAAEKELMAFVRQQSSPLINVEIIKKHMKSIKMPYVIHEGFVGQMDENGNYYTISGRETAGRQLKTKPGGKCYMNSEYNVDKDNTYVFKSQTPGAKNETAFYTKDYGADSQQEKYSLVIDNIPKFEDARNKWIRDIMGNQLLPNFMNAVLCELAYLSTGRIGTKNETVCAKGINEGKHTYGLRTLLCKHATVEESRIVIKYLGVKTSADLKHYIYKDTPQGKKIYDYIVSRVAKAGKLEPLFVHNKTRVPPTKINAYIKSLGLTITVHKFRTIQGTKKFIELYEKSRVLKTKTPDPKNVLSELDKILKSVGASLGHYTSDEKGKTITGNTALQYYIVPNYVIDIFLTHKIRMPSLVQKLYDELKSGKSSEDEGDD